MVSVIVPVYNTEKYILECVESIVCQSYKDIELILVNDATKDRAIELVEKEFVNECRLKIINKKENEGLMMARQTGIKAAQGEYIIFCDSDDWLPLDSVECLLEVILSTESDIVIGNYETYRSGVYSKVKNLLPFGNDSEGVICALLHKKCAHSLWGKIYKKSLFANNSFEVYPHLTQGEDAILFYQLAFYAKKVFNINSSVYCYRANLESATSSRFSEESLEVCFFSGQWLYRFCNKHNLFVDVAYKRAMDYVVYFLERNYDKSLVCSLSILPIDDYSFSNMTKEYGLWKSLYYFVIFHSQIFRSGLFIIKKVLKRFYGL